MPTIGANWQTTLAERLPGADWKLVPAALQEYHGIDLTTDSQTGVDQRIDALRPA